MNAFKVGDVVCLRSGGPDMTVERIEAAAGDVSVVCVWFVEQSLYAPVSRLRPCRRRYGRSRHKPTMTARSPR